MLDFLLIAQKRNNKRPGIIEVYPKFIVGKHSDLMVRGGDFYAVWVENQGLWSTDENDAIRLIDKELDDYADSSRDDFKQMELEPRVLHLWDAESGMVDRWHKFCQKQLRDNFRPLDETLTFANTGTKKENYASRKLPYPLTEGEPKAWNRLMSVLYSPEERRKIEWAIGAVVTGESKKIQKFLTLYGSVGTGKSTVIGIIQKLFEGYYCVFEAKNLGSANNAFALEAFRNNPLVAIQHDGDLSRIEDNTRLNSLVSHEEMTVNEKFKSAYSVAFKCFLFMGTNKPVKITDAKSGLMRRLIDVTPSGEKLPLDEYERTMAQIDFELGQIAWRCRNVYLENRRAYDDYIPLNMLQASNDFYNFMADSFPAFRREDGVTAAAAWEMYKTYCDEAKVNYPLSKRPFREELKNYFRTYEERHTTENGTRVRSWYSGLRTEKFEAYSSEEAETEPKKPSEGWLKFDRTESLLDREYADCPAQYASDKETPLKRWDDVTSTLSELDTSRLHYVMPPSNHIFVDFDIPDETGGKSFERNLQAAEKWPPTYAELSKSGAGIHLHYIYSGDVTKLAKLYEQNVEIKVFSGKSSLRRKLAKCNDVPITILSSGLPLKGEKTMINDKQIKSEKGLRRQIERNLNKEIHPDTHSSVNFIAKILEDAYASNLSYDVTDLRNDILAFAAQSTNHGEECVKSVAKMKFKSAQSAENLDGEADVLVFFDVEVFPNLFVVCYKEEGEGKSVVKMINPTATDIEGLMRFRLVGFNNRKYDNHILYGAFMGYSPEQLYRLSNKIVREGKGFFGEAYNVSYTDIYDFSSKKQSLKKFEIELGIHHQELGLPWDEPVDEKLWGKVADYCANDVLATEATFHARKADFTARQILADVAGMTVNDTTNSLTTRIIFGGERKPQSQFNYRDMGEDIPNGRFGEINGWTVDREFTRFKGVPAPGDENAVKLLPIFPGYKYENGKSTYRDEEIGEGGYVYAEPGIYTNVALLDIASQHPSSIIAENLFGPYTARYKDILDARLAIKHGDFEKAKTMLGGTLAKYLDDKETAADLAQALKIVINSVYGLTSAKFDNPFRDIRNVDNIVAKRGALFMVNLKHEVQNRGYTVAHIKTDSIKIPNATPEIISFVSAYGKLYGYTFEHEATYDRMCLVNDAVYIAKYASAEDCEKQYGYIPEKCAKKGGQWTATGTQFAVPYVFKTLFTREEIGFESLCETKSVQKGALYLDMNESLPDVTELEKRLEKEADRLKSDEGLALEKAIGKGHDYHFIGRVGQFCPMKPGTGGGILLREKDGKYYAAPGTKGYRWMESEMVRLLGKEADVDISYYKKLAEEAKAAIEKYGDFDAFVSSEPYDPDECDLPF